jgi:hypothetical protein
VAGEIGREKPDWDALADLENDLRLGFRDVGVDHVEYVVAFIPPFEFSVWLGTSTDAERDSLSRAPDLSHRVQAAAEGRDLGTLFEGVAVESKETLDREYEGSWFYRLR